MTSGLKVSSIREAFHEVLDTRVDDGIFCLEESGWYVDYTKSKEYGKRIKETQQLYKFDVKKCLRSEISQLKRSGFRMIRKSQMPNELETLQSRSTSSSS